MQGVMVCMSFRNVCSLGILALKQKLSYCAEILAIGTKSICEMINEVLVSQSKPIILHSKLK